MVLLFILEYYLTSFCPILLMALIDLSKLETFLSEEETNYPILSPWKERSPHLMT